MSYDYWNFVGNTNLITNQEVTIGNICWRYLGIWVWLTVWWMMIAGLALNKRSSSSKVKQTLQRKLWNSLFVKATQRSKFIRQIFKTLNPTSGVDDSSHKKNFSWHCYILAKDSDNPVLTTGETSPAKPSAAFRGQRTALSCLPGKLQNICPGLV